MSNYDDLLSNAPANGQNGQLSKEDYAAKKKAEREDVFALADNTALGIAGDGGRFQQYLDVQSTFDRYSAVNTLLILAQKPESTRLGDFEHWKEKGGFVKPGQTGIAILEPQEYAKEDGTPGIGYNIKKVFDISQIDARKVKTTPSPKYDNRQLLKALIHKAPVKIIGVDDLQGGLGAMTNPDTGEIHVRKGMGFADTFRSIALELSIAELTSGPKPQADTLFSAFCASYLLCKKYGVDTQGFNFGDAPAVFEGFDAQEIKGELSQIRDATFDISGRMAKQLDLAQKAVRPQEAR
jgi:hypothetical protein